MRFSDALDEVLRSATHVRVLRALFRAPRDFGLSGREIARRAGVSHPSASKVLSALQQQGLLTTRRSARLDEYALNYEHALVSPVVRLFLAEDRLRDDLISQLQHELGLLGVKRAYVFGSVARGETTSRSDIDLAVEPPTHASTDFNGALDTLRDKIRRRYGNELNIVLKPLTQSGHAQAMWRRFTKDAIAVFDEAS